MTVDKDTNVNERMDRIKQLPSVLTVILNYKTYQMTLNLIDALRGITSTSFIFDVLVVDNASGNESAEVLEKAAEEKQFIFISNPTNTGYATGNNVGLRYGYEHGYEYSLILNNDLELSDSAFLEKMVRVAEKHEDIACVGPKILSPDGSAVAPYVHRPNIFALTIGLGVERKIRQKYVDKNCFVYRIYGCCMLLKNKVLHSVDYLDERTFLYNEEDILGEKLRSQGYRTAYLSTASIIHLGSGTVKKSDVIENSDTAKKSDAESINEVDKKSQQLLILSSLDIYLRYYRNYGPVWRGVIKLFRKIVMKVRG